MATHVRGQVTEHDEIQRRGRVDIISMRRPAQGNGAEHAAQETRAALEAVRCDAQVGGSADPPAGVRLGGDIRCRPTSAGRPFRARSPTSRRLARLGKPVVAAVNGNAHAGGFSLVVACDMAVCREDATLGLPEAANGLFPFLALAIVKDALPKKVLFDLVYGARLMDAHEARSLHLVNEVVARGAVLDRAIAIAERACGYNASVIRLGRDLYYNMRNLAPAQALESRGLH